MSENLHFADIYTPLLTDAVTVIGSDVFFGAPPLRKKNISTSKAALCERLLRV